MAETIDELTVNYTDESGQQIVEEIDKEVLSKGSWTTILFRYREWDRKKEVGRGESPHRAVSEAQRDVPIAVSLQNIERQTGPVHRRDPREVVPSRIAL